MILRNIISTHECYPGAVVFLDNQKAIVQCGYIAGAYEIEIVVKVVGDDKHTRIVPLSKLKVKAD